MSEQPQPRSLKITFKPYELSGKCEDSLLLCSDLDTVKEVINGPDGAYGVEKCLKLGDAAAAATALCLAGKSIIKNWPWVETANVFEDNVLQILAPEQEDLLAELIKDGVLEKQVKCDFENINTNLAGILGRETHKKFGKAVLDIVRDVRIESIKEAEAPGAPKRIVSGIINQGDYDVIERGHTTLAFDRGGDSGGGIVAAVYNAPGAVMRGMKIGGSSLAARGYTAEEAEDLRRSVQESHNS